jgi:hypothetical protein
VIHEGYGGHRKRRTAYRSTWREILGVSDLMTGLKPKKREVKKKPSILDRGPFKAKFWKRER